ncbi:MAG TPA: hypothetical protein VFQ00_12330 [Terriglobales bacterium]|nr:hypothetical protein [Terriglobales bacterium]
MSTAPMPAAAPVSAAAICARYQTSPGERRLLRDGMTSRQFVEELLKKEEFVSAIEFLAHALPPREAIWWGCLCLQHASGNSLNGNDKAACLATVMWVMQPVEQYRAAAAAPAQTAGVNSPAGRLALAVSQLPPNFGQPNQQPLPLGSSAYAANASVADAIKLASVKGGTSRIRPLQKQFVELGLQCAKGHIA